MKRLQRGHGIRIRLAGTHSDWSRATVVMASDSNPSSVIVHLEDAVRAKGGIIAGVLPITIDYDAETVTSPFSGDSYEIEVPDSLWDNCLGCGAVLMGGATQHAPTCWVQEIIDEAKRRASCYPKPN